MSLEGRLRDLRPLELCQMLGASRKTGVLLVSAPLHARALEVRVVDGAVVAATQWPLSRASTGAPVVGAPLSATTPRMLADTILELLTWSDGDFRFAAADAPVTMPGAMRVAMEPVLVEAAHRADVWSRVSDRVASPRVIPSFVDVDPRHLPLLRLAPQEWETLTRVDGRRDIVSLADALGRDVLDVVQTIHSLIGAGLLTIVSAGADTVRHPTPPTQPAVYSPLRDGVQVGDVWIPPTSHDRDVDNTNAVDESAVDPLAEQAAQGGEAPPSAWTPRVWQARVPDAVRPPWHAASQPWPAGQNPVAPTANDPSHERAHAMPVTDPLTSLASRGDDAARRGDLTAALTLWSAALREPEPPVDADRIREAIALAARLHALLHPSRPTSAANAFTRAS